MHRAPANPRCTVRCVYRCCGPCPSLRHIHVVVVVATESLAVGRLWHRQVVCSSTHHSPAPHLCLRAVVLSLDHHRSLSACGARRASHGRITQFCAAASLPAMMVGRRPLRVPHPASTSAPQGIARARTAPPAMPSPSPARRTPDVTPLRVGPAHLVSTPLPYLLRLALWPRFYSAGLRPAWASESSPSFGRRSKRAPTLSTQRVVVLQRPPYNMSGEDAVDLGKHLV
ncbi:hypothetical protein GGX14DRAFT_635590 [Mycena pura]|uniref:Uncharacterized protein n=1 Tax=Mycena pura TaxID=153505 RepID=A0AAD6VBQ4_9AGAR|nr:hypothetical protein GGX14DRAFT_635590 [Mycena pura]